MNAHALAAEVDEVVDAVNALAYAVPDELPSAMAEPVSSGTDDTLGALLTGVLGNLVGRLSRLEGIKSVAVYAGTLAGQAREHQQSAIWRTMSPPPLKDLTSLSQRLGDVSCILHEMAHDSRPPAVQTIVKVARKANLGTAVRVAARRCRHRADRRFRSRLRKLEHSLIERGWNAHCVSRAIDKCDSVYWPAREVAIVVGITDVETQFARWVDDTLSLGKHHLEDDWPFSTVPVMNNQVVAPLALRPSSLMPLPDTDFACRWSDCLDKPFFSSILMETFDEAVSACMEVSAIVACRDLQNLHPVEDEILSKALDTFKRNRDIVANAADLTETAHFATAIDYLDRSWIRVINELESVRAGRSVEDLLCMTPHLVLAGEEEGNVTEDAAIRVFLLQAECGGTITS